MMLGLLLPLAGFSQMDCASAEVVEPGVPYFVDTYTGDLPDDVSCSLYGAGGAQMGAAWYSYTATADGVAIIASDQDMFPENTGADTRLLVYTGECGNLTCYASNDDVSYGDGNLTSFLIIPVTAGTTYYIVWDDRWEDLAEVSFAVEEIPADCTTSFPYETTFADALEYYGCFRRMAYGDLSTVNYDGADVNGDGETESFVTSTPNDDLDKNDWLFTPAFSMTAGNIYEISYTYNGFNYTGQPANETLTSYILDAPNADTATFMQEIESTSGIVQTGTLASLLTNASTTTGSFTPTTSGEYYLGLNVTSPPMSGFLVMFGITISETLATGEHNANNFSMFPNPASTEFRIIAQNQIDSVEIYNMLGQRVASQAFNTNEVSMNISHLNSGAYTVKVMSAGTSQTMKVVKQ